METLHPDTKSKIIDFQKQIKSFTFYFGLHLSKKLYGITDSLSKTFQKKKMSAARGRNLAGLNINTLKKYEKQ